MSFEELENLLVSLQVLLFISNFIARETAERAVKGSHVRYVASSIWLTVASVGLLVSMVYIIAFMGMGRPSDGLYRAILLAYWVWQLTLALREDNWFNDQLNRIKRGIKTLRRKLANTTPRLAPSPSPA